MISKKRMITAVMAFISIFSSLFAEEAANHPIRARIDLIGDISTPKVSLVPNKEDVLNCVVRHPVWGKEDVKKYRLTSQSVVLPYNKWLQCKFSFIPQENGEVEINLLSDFSAPPDSSPGVINAHWVYYSNLKVQGGIIRNGNFIQRAPETGKVLFWRNSLDNLVKSPHSSNFIKNIVKAWHFCRLAQRIKVKANQKVTIFFMAKACKFVPADKIVKKSP